jgi:hypothetical protein
VTSIQNNEWHAVIAREEHTHVYTHSLADHTTTMSQDLAGPRNHDDECTAVFLSPLGRLRRHGTRERTRLALLGDADTSRVVRLFARALVGRRARDLARGSTVRSW